MYARFGDLVYQRRWAIIALWLIAVIASIPLASRVGLALKAGGFSHPGSEGAQAIALLHQELNFSRSSITLLFSSDSLRADDPSFVEEMERALAPLRSHPQVQEIITSESTGNPRFIAPDGHTTYVLVGLRVETAVAQRLLPELKALIGTTTLQVWLTGAPVAYTDLEVVSHRDLQRAERYSFPLALVALVLVFGSVVGGVAPVVVGGSAVVVTLALLYLLAHVIDLSIFVMNIATMLGLGLSIDYSLLMVSRFREELEPFDEAQDKGRGVASGPSAQMRDAVPEAVAATMASAGKAVLVSGVAVFLGLVSLLGFPFMMLRSVGIGGALVVVMAALAALTLLPALLGVLGHRINSLRVYRGQDGRSGLWARIATWVTAHPWPVFASSLLFLLALGSPFLRVRLGPPDITMLPADVPSRQGFNIIQEKYGVGQTSPILVVLEAEGPILSQENVGALYDYAKALEGIDNVKRVDSVVTLRPEITKGQYQLIYSRPDNIPYPDLRKSLSLMAGGRVALMTVVGEYRSTAPESKALVRQIRAMNPPEGMKVYVGGAAAELMDLVDELYTLFPRALLFIVFTTYIALFLFFRSLVIPLKAILMDGLSILASYGALVMLFQDGHLSNLLRFTPPGYVDATVPIIMFCVLFGLSMDYEVFMLSRVKEVYEATGDNARSVALGLERTGRIITSAALIIVIVAGSFVFAEVIVIKALGVGVALAILLDATIVRALLVPSTMQLLGGANWWAPRGLKSMLSPAIGTSHDRGKAAPTPNSPISASIDEGTSGPSDTPNEPRSTN